MNIITLFFLFVGIIAFILVIFVYEKLVKITLNSRVSLHPLTSFSKVAAIVGSDETILLENHTKLKLVNLKEDELIDRKHTLTSEKKKAKKDPIPSTGNILIMEDEDYIREGIGEVLIHLGYHVELAKNGEEAIALYKAAKSLGQSFDLIIMDLTIHGGMDGREAIKKLLEIDPNVKALVSSGYLDDPVLSDYKKYGFCGIVTKPFNIRELSETIHEIIEKKDGC